MKTILTSILGALLLIPAAARADRMERRGERMERQGERAEKRGVIVLERDVTAAQRAHDDHAPDAFVEDLFG